MPFRRDTLEDAIGLTEPTEEEREQGRVVNTQSVTGTANTIGPIRPFQGVRDAAGRRRSFVENLMQGNIRQAVAPEGSAPPERDGDGAFGTFFEILRNMPLTRPPAPGIPGQRLQPPTPTETTMEDAVRGAGRGFQRFAFPEMGDVEEAEAAEEPTEPTETETLRTPDLRDLTPEEQVTERGDLFTDFEGQQSVIPTGFEAPSPIEGVGDPTPGDPDRMERLQQTARVLGAHASELMQNPQFHDFLIHLGQAMTGPDAAVDAIGDFGLEQNRADRQREFISRLQAGESPGDIDIAGMGREEMTEALQLYSQMRTDDIQEQRVQVERDRLNLQGWQTMMEGMEDEQIEGTLPDGTRTAIMEEVGTQLLPTWLENLPEEERELMGVSRILRALNSATGPDGNIDWSVVRADLDDEGKVLFNNLLQTYALANVHYDIDPTVLTQRLSQMSGQEVEQLRQRLEGEEDQRLDRIQQGRQLTPQDLPEFLQEGEEQRQGSLPEEAGDQQSARQVEEQRTGGDPVVTDADAQNELAIGSTFVDSDGRRKMIVQRPDGGKSKLAIG